MYLIIFVLQFQFISLVLTLNILLCETVKGCNCVGLWFQNKGSVVKSPAGDGGGGGVGSVGGGGDEAAALGEVAAPVLPTKPERPVSLQVYLILIQRRFIIFDVCKVVFIFVRVNQFSEYLII